MSNDRPIPSRRTLWGTVAAVATIAAVAVLWTTVARSDARFGDVREETMKFMQYEREIQLTAEEQAVMDEALGQIPAPCCSDNSAATCCCPCNMAKTWWGLSKHLIANEGAGVEEVKVAVEAWIEHINPKGFSGDVCYTGGCNRGFADNGCGGMNPNQVVF